MDSTWVGESVLCVSGAALWGHRYESLAACFAPKWAVLLTRKLPSAILSSSPCFRAKAKICREGRFLHDKPPDQPAPPPRGAGGQCPKGTTVGQSRPGGRQVCRQTRAVCGELRCCFITVVWTGHQGRRLLPQRESGFVSTWCLGPSLVSFCRAALLRGTRGGWHILLQHFCARSENALNAAALGNGYSDTFYMCILPLLIFLDLLVQQQAENFFF